MSAIPPCSEIRFLTDIRLKPDYEHTIWWVSAENQFNYFSGKTKHTVRQVQYVREDRNAIKVPLRIADLMDCNYMIMWNPGHENKKYYAFVTGLEYIGETTTLVRFQVDLIQTWYFECELMPCLVEREHSVTDVFGENLRPEPVAVGDYVIEKVTRCDSTSESVIVVASTAGVDENGDYKINYGGMYGKMYSGLHYLPVTADEAGAQEIQSLLTWDGFDPFNDIVSIFMAPKFCFFEKSGIASADKCMAPFGTYTPHNKKLYTYPFNFLRVNAGDSATRDYRYEYWELDTKNNSGTVNFHLYGVPSCNPGVLLRPIGYRNQRSNPALPQNSVEDTLLLTGFPQCAWSSDMFVAFLSQAASTAINVTTGTLVAQGADRHVEYGPRGGNPHMVRNEGGLYESATDELIANGFWEGLSAIWKPERSVKCTSNPDALFNAAPFFRQSVQRTSRKGVCKCTQSVTIKHHPSGGKGGAFA